MDCFVIETSKVKRDGIRCWSEITSGRALGDIAQRRFLFKFVAPTIRFGGFIEREWDVVFETTTDSRIDLDPVEVEQGKFFSLQESNGFFQLRPEDVCLDNDAYYQNRKTK